MKGQMNGHITYISLFSFETSHVSAYHSPQRSYGENASNMDQGPFRAIPPKSALYIGQDQYSLLSLASGIIILVLPA